MLDTARPKLLYGVNYVAHDTRELFSKYPGLLPVTRVAPEVVGIDPEEYSLEIVGGSKPDEAEVQHLRLEYGASITIK